MQYITLLQQCNYVFHECHHTYYLSCGAEGICPLYLPVFTPVRSSFISFFAAIHLQYLDGTFSDNNNERLRVCTCIIKCCITAIWYLMSSAKSAMKFCVSTHFVYKKDAAWADILSTTSFNTEKLYMHVCGERSVGPGILNLSMICR
jgi:hypothetical protein